MRLSRMVGLTELTFALSATLLVEITLSDALLFLKLQVLGILSESFVPISNLLARTQLPGFLCRDRRLSFQAGHGILLDCAADIRRRRFHHSVEVNSAPSIHHLTLLAQILLC